jgi:hypothetical protein
LSLALKRVLQDQMRAAHVVVYDVNFTWHPKTMAMVTVVDLTLHAPAQGSTPVHAMSDLI